MSRQASFDKKFFIPLVLLDPIGGQAIHVPLVLSLAFQDKLPGWVYVDASAFRAIRSVEGNQV